MYMYYVHVYVYVYIYIYIYKYCILLHYISFDVCCTPNLPTNIIPTLTLLGSNFPVNPLWAWEAHPFHLGICSSQALGNPQC